MPTIAIKNGQRQRIESVTPITVTPYWTRVLSMGRGRYHRNTAPFSASAQKHATSLKGLVDEIAHATNRHPTTLWKNTTFVGHVSKFQHYIVDEPNAFAARACLANAEGVALNTGWN